MRPFSPVICITMGYPGGIGPEAIVKSLASPEIRKLASFLIVGDAFVFKKAQEACGKKLKYKIISSAAAIPSVIASRRRSNLKSGIASSQKALLAMTREGVNILFLDLANVREKDFSFGRISKQCGKASIEYITEAVSLIKDGRADAIVTAPIHKKAAETAGFRFPGHTEYLAHLSKTKDFAMMLSAGPLNVVLATTHLAIKKVPAAISRQLLVKKLKLMVKGLSGKKRLKIAVCGLNPHAGDAGLLGDEEIRIITPAIKKAQAMGINAQGPYAADAVFYDVYRGKFDAVLCMYHDQGLVALKMVARDEAVNITLGLPFVRTSPAHGTALDIAGRNIASPESMKQAIMTAVKMAKAAL